MFIANDSSMKQSAPDEVHICSIPHKRMSKQQKVYDKFFLFQL